MQFLTKAKLRFEYRDDNKIKWYTLKSPLVLHLGSQKISNKEQIIKLPKKDLIIVPKDTYRTDIASIPYGLQWLFKPQGKYTRSAIIHDWLYHQRSIKQSYADKIFLKCMKLDKVNFVTRWSFYLAVRAFGWKFKK